MKNLKLLKFLECIDQEQLDKILENLNKNHKIMPKSTYLIKYNNLQKKFYDLYIERCVFKNYEFNECIISKKLLFLSMPHIKYKNFFIHFYNEFNNNGYNIDLK